MINIISSCKMGAGTFEAKFKPLEKVIAIDKIFVLRKGKIEGFEKLRFILLPKICNKRAINFLFTPFILARETRKKKADLIIAYHFIPHAFFAFFASKLTGKPYILCQTGLYIQKYVKRPLIGSLIKYIARKAMFVNVPGSKSRDFWINNGVNPKKVNILHSTIDTEYFKPDNIKKKYDFIYVGRVSPEKQVHLIVKAINELHKIDIKASLLIVGDGSELSKVKSMINHNELNDYIHLTGFQKDVNYWLNQAVIYVMCSNSEGLPTSLMQAMACELVCISSDVGNIPDLIHHNENGFIFSADFPEKLTALMLYAYKSNQELAAMRKNARKTIIKNHSYKSARKKWKILLEEFESKNN
ncbi:MAG: glycosyltransferase family 4 protein [Saprospiraceae bacterium]|nr:glycosyltransferase family 4 protein [Saprospiraceae bacterium]